MKDSEIKEAIEFVKKNGQVTIVGPGLVEMEIEDDGIVHQSALAAIEHAQVIVDDIPRSDT